MRYPDRCAWLYQFTEIFVQDDYGVGRLGASPRVIDAGANIGTFSRFALWARPDASITAIEPDPSNLKYLSDNLSVATRSRVSIVPAALAASDGSVRLSGTQSDCLRTGQNGDREVNAVCLASMLTEPVDLLKVDIEGAEWDVLQAAESALCGVSRVAVEVHRYEGELSHLVDLISLFQRNGLSLIALRNHRQVALEDEPSLKDVCLLEARRP